MVPGKVRLMLLLLSILAYALPAQQPDEYGRREVEDLHLGEGVDVFD